MQIGTEVYVGTTPISKSMEATEFCGYIEQLHQTFPNDEIIVTEVYDRATKKRMATTQCCACAENSFPNGVCVCNHDHLVKSDLAVRVCEHKSGPRCELAN